MSFDNVAYNKIISLVEGEISSVKNLLCEFNSESTEFNTFLEDFISAPSKHIRSVIAFLYLKANNVEIDEKQILLQSVIELIHNATLIHDDIIDESDVRRNLPTFNKKFDNSLAVIAGDYLLSIALKKILSLNNPEILGLFAKAIENMCVGEISQYFSKYKMPTIYEYIEKSRAKTASLFEASLVSASILAGLNKSVSENFANNFGIAFQIRDDILNFSNNDNKPVNNDFEKGIYTAPAIYAECDLKNISLGIEKASQLLDNYLVNTREVLSNLDKNVYSKALLEILDLLKL